MLELLRIHDLALIEDMEMEFTQGMNVLTGETGAGKSFILKALNFVTGEKMTTENVRPGKEKAVVEGLFHIADEQYILRRELAAETGRSRFYCNDRLASQDTVGELKPSLIVHTSQHGQQKLLQTAFQARMLDDFLEDPTLPEEKDRLLAALTACQAKRKALEAQVKALEDKRDILEFQAAEIAKVAPKAGEEEELERQRDTLRNQSGIRDSAMQGLEALRGGSDGPGMLHHMAGLERAATALAKHLEDCADLPGTLIEVTESLKEVENRLSTAARHSAPVLDSEQIESRLYALAQLKRKLKRPLDAILHLSKEIEDNLSFLDSCGIDRKNLEKEEEAQCDALAALLLRLNKGREAAAGELAEKLQRELRQLGFSEHVRVRFAFAPHPLHPQREDCVEMRARLLWQPNPGQAEQPLERIASGGELSRFLLAFVSLMSKTGRETPTLIFDEVDAGVGGITLNRVAEALEALAASRQMILITHWPQLAKRAQRHFVISKTVRGNETFTTCHRLATPQQVEEELARMAGDEGKL